MPAATALHTSPSARPSKKPRHSKPATRPSVLENALLRNKGRNLKATTTNGHRKDRTARTDESRAVVGTKFSEGFGNAKADVQMNDAPDVVEISSGSSSDGSDDEEENGVDNGDDAAEAQPDSIRRTTEAPKVNGVGSHKRERDDEDEDATLREPTFADLLQARSPNLIAVHDPSPPPFTSLAQPAAGVLATLDNPTPPHLTALLTTALRTSDPTLLNTCLLTPSLTTIRLTIDRLASPLTIPLLSHLATTMHRRPGRAGSLMVWVQWILVSHGGYLASLLATASASDPKGARGKHSARAQEVVELMKKLRALERVCDERARGLDRLLALKGKLDLLVAQMEVRKGRQEERRKRRADERVYVEGAATGDDGWDSAAEPTEDVIDVEAAVRADRAAAGAGATAATKPRKGRKSGDDLLAKSRRRYEALGGAEEEVGRSEGEEEEDEMPTTGMLNGIGSDEEDDEDSFDDGESLIDDEAEVTSDDEGEDEEDEFDEDMELDELESEVEAPTVVQKVGKGKGKKLR